MPEHTRAALTIDAAAEACSVGRQIIERAIRNGTLRAKNVSNGDERQHLRISVRDLEAWLDALPDA